MQIVSLFQCGLRVLGHHKSLRSHQNDSLSLVRAKQENSAATRMIMQKGLRAVLLFTVVPQTGSMDRMEKVSRDGHSPAFEDSLETATNTEECSCPHDADECNKRSSGYGNSDFEGALLACSCFSSSTQSVGHSLPIKLCTVWGQGS